MAGSLRPHRGLPPASATGAGRAAHLPGGSGGEGLATALAAARCDPSESLRGGFARALGELAPGSLDALEGRMHALAQLDRDLEARRVLLQVQALGADPARVAGWELELARQRGAVWESRALARRLLRKGSARLVFVGGTSGGDLSFSGWALMRPVTLLGWSSEGLDAGLLQDAIDRIAQAVFAGDLAVPGAARFALREAAAAHAAMERGELAGRVMLVA